MSLPATALRPLDPARARALIQAIQSIPVAIVGDVMLDHFIFGRVNRISPEAPVPVVEFEYDDFRIGGAGNVALNVLALGGAARLAGVVGMDDHITRRLTESLREQRISSDGIVVDEQRPTTRKIRVVTNRHQQVARIDHESDKEIGASVESALLSKLEAAATGAKALVISDYLKGTVTRQLVARAIGIARDGRMPVLVDPKIPHLDYYAGASLLTPNNGEAEAAAQMRIRSHADAHVAAQAIKARLKCRGVLITRGESGMYLLDEAGEGYLPAATREVADVTGAGDTVVAVLALALAAGADIVEAASLANAAAGVSVSKFGPSSVTPAELSSAFA